MSNDKKLALVFSGGGAKGAFGVGVLYEIARQYPDLRWDIVSGTSTGSLITPLAALAGEEQRNKPPSDKRPALELLKDLYLKSRSENVLKNNFGCGTIFCLVPRLLWRVITRKPLGPCLPRGLFN